MDGKDEPRCPKCQEYPPLVHRVAVSGWTGHVHYACDCCGHGWTVKVPDVR